MEQRFELEKYRGPSSRYRCPECGHNHEFARYIDRQTQDHLADHVGRCNRENACGYHFKPTEWLKGGGELKNPHQIERKQPNFEPEPISYISPDLVLKSMEGLKTSNLAVYLSRLFTEAVAIPLMNDYGVGRSKVDGGKGSIYWRIDKDYNVRGGKIVRHNPITGKRSKDFDPYAITGIINKDRDQKGLKRLRFEQSFFGEHLLTKYPNKPVGIVEGERTALIASVYMPQIVWLSTGGASGCKWREYDVYKVLQNRIVTFYPDHGFFNKKTQKTCFQEWSKRVERIKDVLPGHFEVSCVLEDHFAGSERKDEDLADVILSTDEAGLAITSAINAEHAGYPVIFDYTISELAA